MLVAALEIPFEIVSKIFIDCLPPPARVRPSPNQAPLLLAQICRQWRSVALSTADLWTSAALEYHSGDVSYAGLSRLFGDDSDVAPSEDDAIGLLLDAWFARAAVHPLSLAINWAHKRRALPATLLAVLKSYSPRCSRVELHFPRMDLARINAIPGPFPHLRRVILHLTDDVGPYISTFAPFHDAPALRELRISGAEGCSFALSIGPASALTHLEISSRMTHRECLYILSHFPHLAHLSLTYVIDLPEPIRAPEPPPTFPLCSLRLRPYTGLLALVHLPNLRRLTIDIHHSISPNHLLVFTSTACGPLDHLDITFGLNYTGEPLALCLAVAARASTLKIRMSRRRPPCPSIDYRLLHPPDVFPALRTLHVTDFQPDSSYQPLQTMLERRLSTALCSVQITLRDDAMHPDPAALARIVALAAQGICVRIVTRPDAQIEEDLGDPFPPLESPR
ncbi:hypothetical protein C8J57DRAFT_1459464 [Mycena rebaudengoi]|nr:hypothetical protein C8J57DRAFT_1459464 [Mycena rebaudengoi]